MKCSYYYDLYFFFLFGIEKIIDFVNLKRNVLTFPKKYNFVSLFIVVS